MSNLVTVFFDLLAMTRDFQFLRLTVILVRFFTFVDLQFMRLELIRNIHSFSVKLILVRCFKFLMMVCYIFRPALDYISPWTLDALSSAPSNCNFLSLAGRMCRHQ